MTRTTKVVLAVIGLVFLACASPKPDASGNAGAGQASTGGAPAAAGASASKDNPAPVGTEVTVAKGWTVTVTGSELNANAALRQLNQFNKPEAGKQYVTVAMVVRNKGDEPGALLLNGNLGLLTPSGAKVTYSYALGPGTSPTPPDMIDPLTQLQPGGTMTGNMIFQVPVADADHLVMLAEPTITLDRMTDQRFLALK
jgi:hypothetical protein